VSDPLARTESYDYALPEGLIARYPAERRDESRLLVLRAEEGALAHRRFRDLGSLLAPGDLLVLNESRVMPVRLLGRKPTGAACEVLLLRPLDAQLDSQEEGTTGIAPARATGPATGPGPGPATATGPAPGTGPAPATPPTPHRWEALVRPGSKLKPGRRVVVGPELEVVIEDGAPGGGRIVRLETPLSVEAALERYGRVPLPPYLERDEEPLDRERYQTVYARVPGSVAAPTAGLHFTPELLERIEAGGVELARVALHVGPGTFRPVEVERIGEHEMHAERWEVPAATAEAIARTRERGGRVWAVGTTVVRTLESAADGEGGVRPGRGETRLFISPGYGFRVVDALVTNFHLPRSTLLMLVAAFAGHEATMRAYREAIAEGYRFYSYGDAMAIIGKGRGEPG